MFKRGMLFGAILFLLTSCGYRGSLTLPDTPKQTNAQPSSPQSKPLEP